jgi:uncharacterized protein (TIGR03083 family)
MERSRYLEAVRSETEALVDAAETAGLDAAVPSCPEWTVADLLGHIGRVQRWAAGNAVRAPDAGFWAGDEIVIPDASERAAWVRDGVDPLLAVLDRPSDEPCWSFLPPLTLGFWQRRQAHEVTMHRVDAQLAAGTVTPIDPALAADAIDELLVLAPARPWATPVVGNGETAHLHCTDVEGEWLVELTPTGLEVERRHAKAEVALRGPAEGLLLWAQGRRTLDGLEVFGDERVLAALRVGTTF